jgi:hypothetical protein
MCHEPLLCCPRVRVGVGREGEARYKESAHDDQEGEALRGGEVGAYRLTGEGPSA